MKQHNLRKNELQDIVYSTADWIRNNRQTFYSLLGIAIGVILFTAFVLSRYYLVTSRASDKLSLASALLNNNQTDQGMNLLNEIISQYPNSSDAMTAILKKSDILIAQHKLREAKDLIQTIIDSRKSSPIVPLGYTYMGEIQEDLQDYKGAASTYNAFLSKYPDHFLTAKILESLARVYELSGSYEQAKSAYQRIAAEFSNSRWAQSATNRLNALAAIKVNPK